MIIIVAVVFEDSPRYRQTDSEREKRKSGSVNMFRSQPENHGENFSSQTVLHNIEETDEILPKGSDNSGPSKRASTEEIAKSEQRKVVRV